MTGFHADPAALDGLARRLEESEYGEAADSVETAASGELGPLSVAGALTALTGAWSGRIRAVETDFATAAGSVRAAAKAYRTTDAAAADELGRAHG
jgi:hypothetical protein